MDKDSVGKTVVNGNDNNMQKNVFEMYPTIRIETLLGNPMAHVQNKRFVDVDLNRQFLRRRNAGSSGRYKNDDENITTDATITTTTTKNYYLGKRTNDTRGEGRFNQHVQMMKLLNGSLVYLSG